MSLAPERLICNPPLPKQKLFTRHVVEQRTRATDGDPRGGRKTKDPRI